MNMTRNYSFFRQTVNAIIVNIMKDVDELVWIYCLKFAKLKVFYCDRFLRCEIICVHDQYSLTYLGCSIILDISINYHGSVLRVME